MSAELFAKCGTLCGRCPSYRENLITDEDRRRCSEGWLKYHGFLYSPEKLLRKRRQYYLKLLWTFGLYGEPASDDDAQLMLDSQAYSSQKLLSDYARVKRRLEDLCRYGLCCEIVPLVEQGWLTPKGAMRKKIGREGRPAWRVTMSVDGKAGGEAVLKALQAYVTALDAAFGKQAYRHFARADMRVLGEAG